MNKLTFGESTFLKDADLQVGHVYLYKDGRVVVYLGKDDLGKYVFYALASALYTSVDYSTLTLAHHDVQVEYLCSIAKKLLEEKLESDCVVWLKGIPKLHCEFPFASFEDTITDWWNANKDVEGLPKLITGPECNVTPKNLFVAAKDLVPGELYYTGELWRSLFLYLGRNSNKEFCWYYVGNEDILRQNNIREYRSHMDRTKANKKCKRLADAHEDPDAYIASEVEELIKDNWHADLTGLSLDYGVQMSGESPMSPELVERIWRQMPDSVKPEYGSTKEEIVANYYKKYRYLFD